jgi:hypothetical protein
VYSCIKIALIILGLASSAYAHEQTPAYPKMKFSHVKGVVKYELSLFNQREDAKYYQIALFDKDFNSMPFSTKYRIMKVDYKQRVNFDVYVRKSDLKRAMYICTTSKVIKERSSRPIISSMICSKIKEEIK